MKIISLEIENEINAYSEAVSFSSSVSFFTENAEMSKMTDKQLIEKFISENKIINEKYNKALEKVKEIKELSKKLEELEKQSIITSEQSSIRKMKADKKNLEKTLEILESTAKNEIESKIKELSLNIEEKENQIQLKKEQKKKNQSKIKHLKNEISNISNWLHFGDDVNWFFKSYIYDFTTITEADLSKEKYIFNIMIKDFISFLLKNGWKAIDSRKSLNKEHIMSNVDYTIDSIYEENEIYNQIFKD